MKTPLTIGMAALLAAGSCGRSSTPALVVTGSSTIAPLALELAKRFESIHSGVRIDVQTGGSSRGVADARRGLADIGMVSRDLKRDERDLRAHPIARDGVCLIVHRDNPIVGLSRESIVAIYRGEIDNWAEVGGENAPITVVNKAAGRSTLELFLHHFGLEDSEIQADVVIGDNEQGVKTVAGNPHAIGYVSIGTAEYNATHGTPIKPLPLDGIAATVEHVAAGKFPLARTLHFVTLEPPEGLAEQFIRFARSDEAREVIREQYFVPLPP